MFEIANKGNLDQLVKKCHNKLGENIIRIMFAQLVNVMEQLQIKGVMHRDLKPQNIMLDDNYNIKVIDFGDSRRVEEELDEDEEDEPKDP